MSEETSGKRTIRDFLVAGLLGRGAVSFVLATTGVNLSNFLFHVVISRYLGPDRYGVIGALLSLVTFAAIPIGAVQLAVTQSVVRWSDAGRAPSLRRLTGRATLGGLGGMVLAMALAPLLRGYLHAASVEPLLLIAVWIPLATVSGVLTGALIGEYRYGPVALATFLGGGPVRLGIGVLTVVAGFGVTGAIAASVLAQGVTLLILLYVARQGLASAAEPAHLSVHRVDLWLSGAGLTGYTALMGIDTVLARHVFHPAAAGNYVAAVLAAHIALFIPGAIIMVAFPHLVGRTGLDRESRRAFVGAISLTAVLGLAVAGVMSVAAGLVVRVLFGSQYPLAPGVLGILALGSACLGVLGSSVYLHLARRSKVALVPWIGVGLAYGLVTTWHGSLDVVALEMLAVIGATTLATGLPGLQALLISAAHDAAHRYPLYDLPEQDLDLSLVVPFFNPGPRLVEHVGDVVRVLEDSALSFEVLAVSDGSTDDSAELLEGLGLARLRVIRLPENQGKGAALRAGLREARGEYVGFIDGDGDIPAAALPRFLAAAKETHADILYGSKRHADSQVVYPPLRRLYSWGYQQLTRTLFGLPVRDTQTGCKLIRRDALAAVLPRMVEKRFAFDLEMFVVARRQGFGTFVEVPIEIGQRFSSTVSLRSVRDMLQDTAAIFYRANVLKFYSRTEITREELTAHSAADSEETPRPLDLQHLRILILNWRDLAHPRAGGAEVYTQRVAEEWVKLGQSVTLFCAVVDGKPEVEWVNGVRIVRRGSWVTVYREARLFYQREGRGHFDLVIDEINTKPFMAPKWVTDVPVIALIHQVCRELWFYQYSWPIALLGRYILEPLWMHTYRTIPMVTVSRSSLEAVTTYGLKLVTALPQGYDAPVNYAESSLKEVNPTVIFIGRLESHKRPIDALRAYEQVRASIPEAKLWIIGRGSQQDHLRAIAPEGVCFWGRVTEYQKTELISRAHVLVSTSVREGWGLTVTEAALLGTPAITYDAPGLRDSVSASNGITVDPSPSALAEELIKYFSLAIRRKPSIDPSQQLRWTDLAKLWLATIVKTLEAKSCDQNSTTSSDA